LVQNHLLFGDRRWLMLVLVRFVFRLFFLHRQKPLSEECSAKYGIFLLPRDGTGMNSR
jgi:hypothetical protein